jgi:transposase InsO family protein
LVADYYSKYQFVREVPKGKSSSRTIANLTKEIFSEQGVPKIVRSDNGPHFEGEAYKEFAKQYNFQHTTSSPHYPRSNGFMSAMDSVHQPTTPSTFNTSVAPTSIFKPCPNKLEENASQEPNRGRETTGSQEHFVRG